MRRFNPSIVLAGSIGVIMTSWVVAQNARADDTSAQNQNGGVSEAKEVSLNRGTLKDEVLGIKPEVGVLNFEDGTGKSTQRGGVGLALDMNFSTLLSGLQQPLYFGISTGGLYSHIGEVGSNFFGSNSNTSTPQGTAGGNLVIIPGDAKLGYNITDSLRVSGHGGVNVIYNSAPSTINWGGTAASRAWNFFPNVGGDLDIGITKNVAVTLRPDWTLTSGASIFTGTLEFGFALG